MTPDIDKLRELAVKARELSSDHQKPGVWMHLFGDRFVYTRLEDGCRGRTVVGVDIIRNEGDGVALDYVAAANPAAIISIIDALDAAKKRIEALEKALKPFARMSDSYDPTWADTDELNVMTDSDFVMDLITVGVIRNAASTLKGE